MKRHPVTAAQLWASYQELGTLRAVCARHGLVSVGSVAVRLRQAGYTLNPRGANGMGRRYSIQRLIDLVEMNGSYASVAQIIGSTPDAIRMRITRARERGIT